VLEDGEARCQIKLSLAYGYEQYEHAQVLCADHHKYFQIYLFFEVSVRKLV
jgi:hypothetical protein